MKKIEKILQNLERQGVDVAEFERLGNISNGYLKNTLARGADITEKILDKIKKHSKEMYKIASEAILEKDNTEVGVEDGAGLKAMEVSSDLTGLILKSYLSNLAARHRAAAVEIEAILQAMSAGDSSGSGKEKEILKAVHQVLADIEEKKGTENKPRGKGKGEP